MARELGADGYGALIAVIALSGVFSSTAIGMSAVVVREGSRRPEYLPHLVGDWVRGWLVVTPILSAVAFVVIFALLKSALAVHAIVAIVIAEVVCLTAVEGVGRVYQSQGHTAEMGMLSSGLILARLGTFSALMPWVSWEPGTWAWGYLGSSTAYVFIICLSQLRRKRALRLSGQPMSDWFQDVLPFAFSSGVQKIQTEINKPMLARMESVAAAGLYSAAHRFLDLVLLPVLALLETLVPRVYRAPRPVVMAFVLGLIPLCMALCGGVVLVLFADWLPLIIGPSFENAIPLVKLLALLPAIKVVRLLFGIVMTARNLHRYFFHSYGFGALASIMFIALFVPPFGAVGAVMAAYCAEAALILLQVAVLVSTQHKGVVSRQGAD